MNVYHLQKFLSPGSVAILGQEGRGASLYHTVLTNLKSGGYKGQVYPISRHEKDWAEIEAYPSIEAVDKPIDLAVLTGPMEGLPESIRSCARAGVTGVVVLTGGTIPLELRAEILNASRSSGVNLIGPRSWGVVNPWACFNLGPSQHLPLAGNLAVISQSRAICASILDLSLSKQIGLSFLIGLGDTLDVGCADILDHISDHYRVGAVLLHLERIVHMRKFMSAARAASRVKPVVILKTGRLQTLGQAPVTARGGLIQEDAAFERAGIIRVETVEDLFDCGDLVGKQPRPRGPNLAVISNARSPGIMATDFLSTRGIEPVGFSPGTAQALKGVLGNAWNSCNPITLSPGIHAEELRQVLEIFLTAKEVNGILIILTPLYLQYPTQTAQIVASAVAGKTTPVFAVWMGGRGIDTGRRILIEAGIPTYEGPERAVRAFLYLHAYDHNLRLLQEIPPRQPERFATNRAKARKIIQGALDNETRVLSQAESLDLLQAYNLPAISYGIAHSVEQAIHLAERMGYPVILSSLYRDLPTPMRRKLRIKGLHGPGAVEGSYIQLKEEFRRLDPGTDFMGVMVQPQVVDPDLELRVGCRQVSPLGLVMVLGCGGIRAEALMDQAIGFPPLNRILARRLMEGTRILRVLQDEGHSAHNGIALLESFLMGFSHMVTDFPEISEMEISPLIVHGERIQAASGHTLLHPSKTPSPMHLIISPYPDHYETRTRTKGGINIFVRPIKPEDASLLQGLWAMLSERTLYYRFFSPIKKLTSDLLVRFTQIDYDREIALVAIETTDTGDRMLGVSRLMWRPGADSAEFAVVVGDPWQGLGVGAKLLSRLAGIGITRGIKMIRGFVLRENRVMIELARKLGWVAGPGSDLSEVEVRLDLSSVTAPEILEAVKDINAPPLPKE